MTREQHQRCNEIISVFNDFVAGLKQPGPVSTPTRLRISGAESLALMQLAAVDSLSTDAAVYRDVLRLAAATAKGMLIAEDWPDELP